jgi:hypothetical protein
MRNNYTYLLQTRRVVLDLDVRGAALEGVERNASDSAPIHGLPPEYVLLLTCSAART